jgi:hypothetical protein
VGFSYRQVPIYQHGTHTVQFVILLQLWVKGCFHMANVHNPRAVWQSDSLDCRHSAVYWHGAACKESLLVIAAGHSLLTSEHMP